MADINHFWLNESDYRKEIIRQDLTFQLHMLRVLKMERNIPTNLPKPKEVIKRKPGRPKKTEGKRDIIYLDTYIKSPVFAWKNILIETAMKHGMTMERLVSTSRKREVVMARNEAMWRMKHEAGMSYPAICRRVGLLDHSSSIHGVKQYQKLLDAEDAA